MVNTVALRFFEITILVALMTIPPTTHSTLAIGRYSKHFTPSHFPVSAAYKLLSFNATSKKALSIIGSFLRSYAFVVK